MNPVPELCGRWRDRAADLRRYGADPQARALEACADELERLIREHENEELTLDDAADVQGVTRRTIERKIERGEIENVGKPGKPRVRRGDVVTAGPRLVNDRGEPDVAEELLRQRY